MRKVGQFRGTAMRVMAGALSVPTLSAPALGAIAAVGAGVALFAAPAMAGDAKATNSAEFGKSSAPIQKVLLDAQPLLKKYIAAAPDAKAAAMAEWKALLLAENAPAQLAAAETGIKNPYDRYIAGQWGSQIGQVIGDNTLYQHALQNVFDSNVGTPAEKLNTTTRLGIVSYQNKDYASAVKVLSPLMSGNVADDDVPVVLAVSYVGLGQYEQGLAALKTAYDARKAAGGAVPQAWFTRANAIAFNGKLGAQGIDWAVRMAASSPTPENLIIAETLVRNYGAYDNPEVLDCVRLAWRSGAMAAKSNLTTEEYKQFLNAADPRRYPGEVLAVVDAGIANGALSASAISVSEARATASRLVAADRASLPAFFKDAHAAQATAKTVVAAADAHLSYGDNAKAAELYQLALTKPGVDSDVALNRLGIAQVGAGDYAGAQASLAKVSGKRKPLAALWGIYAQAKASGK